MKKEKLLFLIIPSVQVITSIRYFRSYRQGISSIIFIISSFLLSLLLYKVFSALMHKLSNKNIISAVVLLLTFLDQGHKVLLEKTGLNCNIIGGYFQVKQTKNESQMALLNHFGIIPNMTFIICCKLLMLAIILFCLFKVKNEKLKVGVVLLASAQLSSLLDSLIRGYVLDSFYYYKLVCYDLKDYYVDAGLGIILIAIMCTQKTKEKLQRNTAA